MNLKGELFKIWYECFVRCPNTGRILEVLKGDDKVMCRCGKSNPDFQVEDTEHTNTHYWKKLEQVPVEEYLNQLESDVTAQDWVCILPCPEQIQ